jgi:hypothetical protein
MAKGGQRGRVGQVLWGLFGTMFFGAVLAYLLGVAGMDLRDDLAVADAARPTQAVQVVEGRCRSRMMVVQTCDVTLRGSEGARKLTYIFVEFGQAAPALRPVADAARPWLATTELGLDRITNRVVTLAVLAGSAGVLMLLGALMMLRGAFRRGA